MDYDIFVSLNYSTFKTMGIIQVGAKHIEFYESYTKVNEQTSIRKYRVRAFNLFY